MRFMHLSDNAENLGGYEMGAIPPSPDLPNDRDILVAIFNKLEELDAKISYVADVVSKPRQGFWTRFCHWLEKIFT